MGRELRRKEARKNKNVIKNEEEFNFSIKKLTLFKLVIFAILMLVVLYYVIAVFVTKELKISWNKDDEVTENVDNNVSNKILAKNIFNQSEDEYLVYFYDFSDKVAAIDSAISSKEDVTVYRVDTSSGLNKNYVTEDTGNKNVTSLDNLLVKSPTLIKISADKVVEYYEGRNPILEYLK